MKKYATHRNSMTPLCVFNSFWMAQRNTLYLALPTQMILVRGIDSLFFPLGELLVVNTRRKIWRRIAVYSGLDHLIWFTAVCFWWDFRVTVCYGPFPSEWERPLCLTIRCSDGCLPLTAAKLICAAYPCLIFSPAVMTFPEKAFKGSFIEAHSSTLTASSSSPHRYLRSHNDYLTESWLKALF